MTGTAHKGNQTALGDALGFKALAPPIHAILVTTLLQRPPTIGRSMAESLNDMLQRGSQQLMAENSLATRGKFIQRGNTQGLQAYPSACFLDCRSRFVKGSAYPLTSRIEKWGIFQMRHVSNHIHLFMTNKPWGHSFEGGWELPLRGSTQLAHH